LSWTIGGTQLPLAPRRARIRFSQQTREIQVPGSDPWIISWARKSDALRIEGTIASAGLDAEALTSTYITVYEGMVGTEVGIACPNIYSGTYLMTGFDCMERGGYTVSFDYVMEFAKPDLSGKILVISGTVT